MREAVAETEKSQTDDGKTERKKYAPTTTMMAQSCAKWKQTRGKMSRRRRQFVLWMALLVESVASSVFLPTRFVVVVAYCRAPIWMKLTFFLTAFHMSPTTMQWVAWMGCLYRWSSGDLEQHCWWLVECWIGRKCWWTARTVMTGEMFSEGNCRHHVKWVTSRISLGSCAVEFLNGPSSVCEWKQLWNL